MTAKDTLEQVVSTCSRKLSLTDNTWICISEFLTSMTTTSGKKKLMKKIEACVPQSGSMQALSAFKQSVATIMASALYKLLQPEDKAVIDVVHSKLVHIINGDEIDIEQLSPWHRSLFQSLESCCIVEFPGTHNGIGVGALQALCDAMKQAELASLSADMFALVTTWGFLLPPGELVQIKALKREWHASNEQSSALHLLPTSAPLMPLKGKRKAADRSNTGSSKNPKKAVDEAFDMFFGSA